MEQSAVNSDQTRREASVDALRSLYRIVVALAIVEALRRALTTDGQFVGIAVIQSTNLSKLVLLLTFVPTVVRFFHGASIHLSPLGDARLKPAIDFIGFFIQALLFYILALTVNDAKAFMLLFGILIVADTTWLLILFATNHIRLDKTSRQWLVSNMLIFVALILFHIHEKSISDYLGYGLLSVAWIAAVADYSINRNFYFPECRDSSGVS
jgi:hypothetical protein